MHGEFLIAKISTVLIYTTIVLVITRRERDVVQIKVVVVQVGVPYTYRGHELFVRATPARTCNLRSQKLICRPN